MEFLFLIVISVLLIYFLFPPLLSLVDGLGQILSDVVASIKDAFKDKAEEWREIFSRILDIKSPSGTFRQTGVEIIRGLVLGEMIIKLKRVDYRRPYTYRKRLLGISFEVSRLTFTKPYEPLDRALEAWNLSHIDYDD